jgi:hypothetical protein
MCSQGHGRKRAVALAVRLAQSETVRSFIPVSGRRNGNMAQLQQMVYERDGIRMKKGQVYNALRRKRGRGKEEEEGTCPVPLVALAAHSRGAAVSK